tara:strand:- start:68 stop:400 length:333 start_codon:yes stop_codon:yes gene_type:complete
MENYTETLEQVIILLEDNKYITCHGDNIECNQILIDKLHDVYKFIDNYTDHKCLHDLKEWIHVFCSAQDTDWKNLGEGSVQEIRNFLKEDNYTDQQIDQAINNLNYFYNN